MADDAVLRSPPRARLAFRVGIVGHRPDRLPRDPASHDAIRARIEQVLAAVRATTEAFRSHHDAQYYAPEPPLLVANSPLAEGADRTFAEAALAQGFALFCPMPFERAEYERDFADDMRLEPQSAERFSALLRRAAAETGLTTFELAGSRDDPVDAYRAAGRLVLNQSDLLVAVWDGGDSNGGGGTFEILSEAISYHVPVVWIDSRAPLNWSILHETGDADGRRGGPPGEPNWSASDSGTDEPGLTLAIANIVSRELICPKDDGGRGSGATDRDHVADYFAEHRPRLHWGFLWKPFRELLGAGRFTWPRLRVPDFVGQLAESWPTDADQAEPTRQSSVTAWTNGKLRRYYAWSDKLADLYSDAHRSNFILVSLFATLVVALVLAPKAFDLPAISFGVGEIVVVVIMAVLLQRRRGLHERWLEYRVLAELIRQLQILIPLGGGRPLPRIPAYLATYGDPVQSWMYWHVRAIARATGLPQVKVGRPYTEECISYLIDLAAHPTRGQLAFHQSSLLRSEHIHDRLRAFSVLLFWISIGVISVHLLLMSPELMISLAIPYPPRISQFLEDWRGRLDGWLLLLSAVVPALGAALANINNQGEFARLARRSRAMVDIFDRFRTELYALKARSNNGGPAIPLAVVIDIASRMATRMIEENVDWRVVVVDLPHVSG